jgi:hypothetical protein
VLEVVYVSSKPLRESAESDCSTGIYRSGVRSFHMTVGSSFRNSESNAGVSCVVLLTSGLGSFAVGCSVKDERRYNM